MAAYETKIKNLEIMVEARDKEISEMEERLNLLENKSRNANIEIKIFPQTSGVNIPNIVKEIDKKIGRYA